MMFRPECCVLSYSILSHNYIAYVLIDAMLVYNINLYLYRLSITSVGHTYACSKHNMPYCCRHIVYIVLIATIIINVCIYLLYL